PSRRAPLRDRRHRDLPRRLPDQPVRLRRRRAAQRPGPGDGGQRRARRARRVARVQVPGRRPGRTAPHPRPRARRRSARPPPRTPPVGAPGMTSLPLSRRAAGPDLARGLSLLGIALANMVGWLHGREWTVLLKQQDATGADRVVDVLLALLVDNRGFPLFALLFGYGIGMLHRRSRARGEPVRRFLARMGR